MLRMGMILAALAVPGLAIAGANKKTVVKKAAKAKAVVAKAKAKAVVAKAKAKAVVAKKAVKKYRFPWSPRPDATGLYGTKSNEKYLSTNLSALFANTASFKGKLVRVGGRIVGVCQKKGCWMKITDGKNVMRVRFKGYKFFMPVNSKGYMAVVYGYAGQALIPVRWLRHYAEDRGASKAEIAKITKPKKTVAFTASWVELKKLTYKRK